MSYYCTKCGADLDSQDGFSPSESVWTCSNCGTLLYGDEMYDGDRFSGVIWFCDSCNAILNAQPGFSDYEDIWTCSECGHINSINENEIFNSQEEYQNYSHPKCPECGEELTDQYGYSKFNTEWKCTNCGSHIYRFSEKDEYQLQTCESPKCPNCDESLEWQSGFYSSCTDFICKNCYAKLHRDNDHHDFEVESLWEPTCPQCYDDLKNQIGFDADENRWTCQSCHSILEKDKDTGEYSYTGEDEDGDEEDRDEEDEYTRENVKDGKEKAEKEDPPLRTKYIPQRPTYDSYTKPYRPNYSRSYVSKHTPFIYSIKSFFHRLKISVITIGIIALVILLLVSGIRFFRNTKISVDYSSKELIGITESQAKTMLTESGFKNIYVEYLKDLDWDSREKENTVSSVSIGERTTFDRSTVFHNYNSVHLKCHSLKEITINTENITKKDYQTVINDLKRAGFVNVQEEALHDIKLGWFAKEGLVDKILVDGTAVKKGKEYRIDATIIVQYHCK